MMTPKIDPRIAQVAAKPTAVTPNKNMTASPAKLTPSDRMQQLVGRYFYFFFASGNPLPGGPHRVVGIGEQHRRQVLLPRLWEDAEVDAHHQNV